MEKNPDIIQSFTNAIYRAQLWGQEHSPEEIAEVIAPSFPEVELDILTAVAARYKEIDAWAHSPVFTEESFARLQDIMGWPVNGRNTLRKAGHQCFAEEAIRPFNQEAEKLVRGR